MATRLRRFTHPLAQTPAAIIPVIANGARESEQVEPEVSLEALRSAIAGLGTATGTQIDRDLLEPLHRALPLSRRNASDPRVWQWLCIVGCPEIVWRRWWGPPDPPADWASSFSVSKAKRFGCAASLNGISRNTLARLWWVAESFDGDYDLARRAIANQDLFQAIFERRYGLYPPAARACMVEFEGKTEDQIRDAATWLQFSLGTTVLQALDEDAIRAILQESLSATASKPSRRKSSGGGAGTSAVRNGKGIELDAHFRVEAEDEHRVLLFESSGGTEGGPNPRNLDYQEGMALLLSRLASLGAMLIEVAVDSEPMRKRPMPERVVEFDDGRLPLNLAEVGDFDGLRSEMMTRARKVGQAKDQKAKSGGSSRALRLVLDGLAWSPDAVQEALATGEAISEL